jgi:flagellin-like hook-associated protein FlgL
VAAAAITQLDARLERSAQIRRNLDRAAGSLDLLDTSLAELTDLARQAESLAVSQANVGPSAGERSAQATVVDSMIQTLFRLSNQRSLSGFIFGGTQPGVAPVVSRNNGYIFSGERGGLTPDLGVNGSIPVTVGANNAIGSTSTRIEGSVPLRPSLTDDTRIVDLRGARGLGVNLGQVQMVVDGVDTVTLDFSGADTVGDVMTIIEAAIRDIEVTQSKTVLPPGGLGTSAEAFSVNPVAGSTVEFRDIPGGTTAEDLGLLRPAGSPFALTDPLGADLGPLLTRRTPVAALQAISAPLGEVVVRNNGVERVLDLSGAETVADIESVFESAGMSVRVELAADGQSINIVNELAGGRDQALSIRDTNDGTRTAARLGIRSFQTTTRIADFNFGRGVDIVDGNAIPNLNFDFEVEVGSNPPGTPLVIPIAFVASDMADVGSVLLSINSQINASLTLAGRPVTDLEAVVADDVNGITFRQAGGVTTPLVVRQRNNSPAFEQLGLSGATWDAANNRLVGADRAEVRVDNLFTHLIDLADSLRGDSTFGIQLASEKIEQASERLTELRALIGGYARRVDDEVRREEDRGVLDEQIRSGLRDTDFTEATSRFTLLQTQLEAGLRTASLSAGLSLLDFI